MFHEILRLAGFLETLLYLRFKTVFMQSPQAAGKKDSSPSGKQPKKVNKAFDHFSARVTKITGRPVAFISAVTLILIWAATGPLFGYSETWQLIINTGTTIITFLMVFVIQQSQNKDMIALHLKLDELLSTNDKASNRLVNSEGLSEEELELLKDFYARLSQVAGKSQDVFASHSIEEAEKNEEEKEELRKEEGISGATPPQTQTEGSLFDVDKEEVR